MQPYVKPGQPRVDPSKEVDLDAETEPLGGSESSPASPASSDPIPDNFMGVPDVPEFFGSSSESVLCLVNWSDFLIFCKRVAFKLPIPIPLFPNNHSFHVSS